MKYMHKEGEGMVYIGREMCSDTCELCTLNNYDESGYNKYLIIYMRAIVVLDVQFHTCSISVGRLYARLSPIHATSSDLM